MLEIYNEKVKDLLVKSKQAPEGLKIRQNPQAGFYVDGLKVRPSCSNLKLTFQDCDNNYLKRKPIQYICCTWLID